jgi:hypothetical protein
MRIIDDDPTAGLDAAIQRAKKRDELARKKAEAEAAKKAAEAAKKKP